MCKLDWRVFLSISAVSVFFLSVIYLLIFHSVWRHHTLWVLLIDAQDRFYIPYDGFRPLDNLLKRCLFCSLSYHLFIFWCHNLTLSFLLLLFF